MSLDASAAVEDDAAAERPSDYIYVFTYDGSAVDGCVFPSGKCLPAFVGMERCRFESGSCFFLSMRSPGDEDTDMPLPPGFPPPKKHIQPVVVYDMAPPAVVAPGEPMVPAIPSGLPTPNVPGGGGILADALPGAMPRQAVPSALPGTVGVPSSAAHELQNLPPASAISPLSIVLALVAVGGGAAAWKFYSQWSSQKHEQNMKKLDNDAARVAQQDEQRQQKCEAAAEACSKSRKELAERCDDLAKRLSAAVERVEALEKQLRDNFSADEETVDRIKAVEQKVRTTVKSQKAKKKPNGKKEPA